MSRIHLLTAGLDEPADLIGAKAQGLVVLHRLGLPVPPGFVIEAGHLPREADLAAAARDLGAPAVSVRSGAAVSMPGMMDTVLDVPASRLAAAVRDVLASWHTPRAVTYRELHGIAHDLGTAVIVQAMVHGDRDDHSGAGVAFSRDPVTGANSVSGDVLFGHRGRDVVSGEHATLPLTRLAGRAPAVWAGLVTALRRIEQHYRDACHVEFTVESGRLWLLQVRAGGFTGRAGVRVAVDLVDEGLIDRREAVRRVTPRDLRDARAPRIRAAEILARGRGACPGVAAGRVALTADRAVRMAADGPVILVRPVTSPLDLHGLAAAAGIVTSRGGPASHAAVVARAMGKPAVVGATAVAVDAGAARVRVGDRVLGEGTTVTIDGAGGEIVLGDPGVVLAAAEDARLRRLAGWVS